MNLKFLPIGTVCLVDDVNKKQLIIGYLKGGYDYVAVEYPKGFESDTKLSYFNHSQVRELYSLGYKNEESRIFNGILKGAQTDEDIEQIPMVDDILANEKPFIRGKLEPKQLPKRAIVDEERKEHSVIGLKFDRKGIVSSEKRNPDLDGPLSVVSGLKLHKNDIVIPDTREEIESPVTINELKSMITEKKVEESPSISTNKIRFNKYGIVVAEETEPEKSPESVSKVRFIRDKIVMNRENIPSSNSKLEFGRDESLITDESDGERSPVAIRKIRFSKDGIVMAEKKEQKEEIEKSIIPDKESENPNRKEDDEIPVDNELNMNDCVVGEFDSEIDSLPLNGSVDIAEVVKRIEEDLNEESGLDGSSRTEKKGLFHFGKK